MNTNIRDIIFSPWRIKIQVNDRVKSQVYDEHQGFYDVMIEQCSSLILEQIRENIKDYKTLTKKF
jgi:hypothetical protein